MPLNAQAFTLLPMRRDTPRRFCCRPLPPPAAPLFERCAADADAAMMLMSCAARCHAQARCADAVADAALPPRAGLPSRRCLPRRYAITPPPAQPRRAADAVYTPPPATPPADACRAMRHYARSAAPMPRVAADAAADERFRRRARLRAMPLRRLLQRRRCANERCARRALA